MTWPPDIANELPAPRDDEPSSLRQDIADELADHLQSSLARELHFTPEESTAKQTILERFGDPRRIARRLWFDAMQEKIMSQRVQLILTSLMTAACLGAVGLMTFMLRDSREVNGAILEKLAALTTRQPAPEPEPPAEETTRSLDWVRAKFKLSLGEKGGPPAVGFKVQVTGTGGAVLGEAERNGQITVGVIEETSGADGVVDLGLFRFGTYFVSLATPWGEVLSRQVALRPGQPPVREIVCPAAAPEEVDVQFKVTWPEDLKEHRLWLICNVSTAQRRTGSEYWTISQPFMRALAGNVLNSGLMGGMGGMMGGGGGGVSNSPALILSADGKVSVRPVTLAGANGQNAGGSFRLGTATFINPSHFDDSLPLVAAMARLMTIDVVKPDDSSGSQTYPILARYPQMAGGMGGGGGGGFFNVADDGQPAPQRPSFHFSFTPVPGQPNEWTITLSDYVLDRIRASLKEPPPGTSDQEEPADQ
jgi:hypothetical protein